MIGSGIVMNTYGIAFIPITYAIQMHVLAMFVPSVFMGKLINRYGAKTITLGGTAFMILGTFTAIMIPTQLLGFQIALIFYGLGWNMMFIGGSFLAVNEADASVSVKFQAYNNLIIGVATMLSSSLAGAVTSQLGWVGLNQSMMVVGVILFAALLVLFYTKKYQAVASAN